MSQAIAKITLFCWGFVSIFGGVLIVARALPPKSLPLVSLIAGATAASVIGLRIFRVCRARGGLGRLGRWDLLVAGFGFAAAVFGAWARFFPAHFQNHLASDGWAAAKVLVAGFWLALISTFLGWALICFAEMTGYLRLKRFKWAFYAFALGMLWQLFSLAFCHLFLEVLDEIFFAVSATSQNWALAAIGFSTLFLGALIGQHEPLPGADD